MQNYHNLKRFFFDNISDNKFLIQNQDYLHAKNVMRLKVGDNVIGIRNNGFDYLAKIIEINKHEIICEVLEKVKNNSEPFFQLDIFQSLLKNDKIELITQKCTELGATSLIGFTSEFCQIKANTTRFDRLEKITQESAKQCKRSNGLVIKGIISFNEMLEEIKSYDAVIFAYELENQKVLSSELLKNKKKVAIIIGSEGGFSSDEAQKIIDAGAICVSLGKRILRAETATIHLCGLVTHYLELNK